MIVSVSLILQTDYHIRNYLSGLVDYGSDPTIEYHIILPKRFESKEIAKFGSKTISYVDFGDKHIRLFSLIREINLFKHSRKSSSFQYTLLRLYPPLLSLLKKNTFVRDHGAIESKSLHYKQMFRNFKFLKQGIFLAMRHVRKRSIKLFAKCIACNSLVSLMSRFIREDELLNTIENCQSDFVIFVSSLYEYASIPISRYCKERNKTYMLIADNWDNISSKRTLWEKPNYVGVWGPQTCKQAQEIHDLDNSQIVHVGTPRLMPLLDIQSDISMIKQTQKNTLSIQKELKNILFVGSSLLFDEASIVRNLLKEMSNSEESTKLVYRPYPWRIHDIPDDILKHPLFTLDPTLSTSVLGKKIDNFDPRFEEYAELISSADLVVGSLTTMVLEASILSKRVIGLVYHDEYAGVESPDVGFRMCEHFKGLEYFPNLSFCYDLKDLWQMIYERLSGQCEVIDAEKVQKAARWFYDIDSNQEFINNLNSHLVRIQTEKLE